MTNQKNAKWRGKLSATRVARIRQPGYYRDYEVPGLWLRVQNTSRGISKSWVQRVTIDNQVTNLGHGPYPDVTLQEARRRAWAALDEIAADRDPRRSKDRTVRQVGGKVVEIRSVGWRGTGTRKRWETDLAKFVYPHIGELRVKVVTSAHLMAFLVPLVREKPETARQVLSHLRVIFAWVRANNLRGDDPTEIVAKALGPIKTRGEHMPALPHDQVARALESIDSSRAHWATKSVAKVMAHTGARQKEIRGARWEEVNYDDATLTVPGSRTKSGKPHRIPLTGPVLAIFDQARERTGGVGFVFPSQRGGPISDGTLSKLMKAHRIRSVPHGYRSSVASWAIENRIERTLVRLILGHTVPDLPAGIDLLEQRRAVMEQWSRYLTGATTTD